MMAKVVMVLADGRMTMLVLPATHRVDLTRAQAALGATEVRVATEDQFANAFPDCEAGAMPPFGNLYEVPVCVDERLAEVDTIVFRAGTHQRTMSLKYGDFTQLVQPTVASFAHHV
jgi:Ala-tRNA(Pro) deacylase